MESMRENVNMRSSARELHTLLQEPKKRKPWRSMPQTNSWNWPSLCCTNTGLSRHERLVSRENTFLIAVMEAYLHQGENKICVCQRYVAWERATRRMEDTHSMTKATAARPMPTRIATTRPSVQSVTTIASMTTIAHRSRATEVKGSEPTWGRPMRRRGAGAYQNNPFSTALFGQSTSYPIDSPPPCRK